MPQCVEQLSLVQKELQISVQDVDKTKKLYFDEEHCAHDVRDKARDIEEKYWRMLSIFGCLTAFLQVKEEERVFLPVDNFSSEEQRKSDQQEGTA